MTSLRVRAAGSGDAESIALLHADSWRRHFRGPYADSFLDGDVVEDRRYVWSARLASPVAGRPVTLLADDGDRTVGFVHVFLDEDERWGSLVDNLHVAHDRRRTGIGRALLRSAAAAVVHAAAGPSLYLWVLAQNLQAQRFYRALGGACVGEGVVSPPGGVPSRLNGTPGKLRFAWPDAAILAP